MKEIKVISATHGVKSILLDDEDYEKLKGFTWTVLLDHGTFYAQRAIKRIKHIRMHREILGISDPKIIVDHKNGDGLDNQKSNLRLATHGQNMANSKKHKDSVSKFKGARWDKERNKWRVLVKGKHIGRFDSEVDAAKAYNMAAIEAYGEFALLNKIA